MKVQSDVGLADKCTLAVGGAARWFCQAQSETDIVAALAWADTHNVAVHVLGGGSNVVFADEGFDGLVIHIDIRGVERVPAGDRSVFSAGAGEAWDPFVASTVFADCAGLECLSGIPGQVGGTPVQNVGAYGQDVSGSIVRVHAIDRQTHQPVVFAADECGFGYRTSRFRHHHRFTVTRVEFALVPAGPPTVTYADVVRHFADAGQSTPSVRDVREAILQIRRRKGMVIEEGNPANRSVGSFFVNPIIDRQQFDGLIRTPHGAGMAHYAVDANSVKVPAAWLIERAGFPKGYTRGTIGVSPFQAQAIVNHGGAQAIDVLTLAADIKRAVWKTFAIALVPEPIFVGFGANPDLEWLLEPQPTSTNVTPKSN